MPTTVQLNITTRTTRGKGAARKLRAAGKVPGVLYGQGADPVMIELDEHEFLRTLTGHSASNLIVDLSLDGGSDLVKTLIREIQVDPLDNNVVHIDLNRISMTEKVEVEVPLELEGIPVGVKETGGVLQQPFRALPIRCLVANIPNVIKVDVTGLNVGDSLHVADLDLPDVDIMEKEERTIATVVPPTVHTEPTAEEAEGEAAEEGAEPELVGKDEDKDTKDGGEKKD